MHHTARVACGLWLLVSSVSAQSVPWYLEADTVSPAPAAIRTAPYKPGPHPVTVAVIDSGVIAEHPALKGVLLPGYDMVSGALNQRGGRSANFSPDPREASCGRKLTSASYRTHGTEVASVVAGNGYQGMWGVNTAARILPIRLMSTCGVSMQDLSDAIRWAVGLPVEGLPDNPHHARVINLSISGGAPSCSPRLQAALNAAIDRGVFIVAAAGNNFQQPLGEPANCEGVISVGALSAENRIAKYSALDPRTSIYSPGGGPALDVKAVWASNKVRVATEELNFVGAPRYIVDDRGVGTSFAAPLVSGFISLWLSHQPHVQPDKWSSMISTFGRTVPPLDKCASCTPLGLVAAPQLMSPSP
jgi:serine protease